MRYVIKGIVGVAIGVGYGLLVGALIYVWWQLTNDPDHPGPMIPDNNGWGRMVTFFATVITAACGALVGLIVGLSGAKKRLAGMIGAGVGLLLFLPFMADSCSAVAKFSWPMWRDFLLASFMLFLIFPFGLALAGLAVSTITSKLSAPLHER
jgi:hypothetical protein